MEFSGNIAARCRIVYALTVFLIVSALSPYLVSASESSPQRAFLCTSMGYQWVNIAEQDESGINTSSHCVYCLFSSADNPDSILGRAYNASPPEITQLIPLQLQTKLAPASNLFSARPRAPPLTL